jgi:uncharacterized protein (UPF0548 family)
VDVDAQRIAEVAGGRVVGGIDIHTRRVMEPHTTGVAARVAALRTRPLNFDPEGPHPESDGWRRDAYCESLPSEPPGRPVEGGSFRIAQTLLRDYKVADPSIVRAYYDHDAPLEGRNMLLELWVGPFHAYGGCRVGHVIDEQRTVEGRPVCVWGWPYQTLEGHIEQGEMSWEVWKWLDTGEVQFRVHSYSRLVHSRNPLTTIGVWLFGQRQRHRFLTAAGHRIGDLTVAAQRGEDPAMSIKARVGRAGG